jgi:DNA-binding LytR/AlgR family response regulator
MPTTALIADDEEAPRARLRSALHRVWPELAAVHGAANGVDAWDAFLEHEPQVCFLDVRMPGMTGIEVARRIGSRAHVVFVTAHDDHAVAAFDAGAVDYLLKPVEDELLSQAVLRVKADLAGPRAGAANLLAPLAQLASQVRRPAPLEVIQAGVGKEIRLVRVEDVIYFESDSRCTRVVHEGGEVLVRTPLKELLAQLDGSRFWQIHRSVIVNHRHIASAARADDGNMVVTLRGRSEHLPVSPPFQSLFDGQ